MIEDAVSPGRSCDHRGSFIRQIWRGDEHGAGLRSLRDRLQTPGREASFKLRYSGTSTGTSQSDHSAHRIDGIVVRMNA